MAKLGDFLNEALKGGSSELEKADCVKLAQAGEDMDVELRKSIRETIDLAGPDNYFAALITQGFTWPEYTGKDADTWFRISIEYLVSGKVSLLAGLSDCSGHFGEEKLEEALRSWKILHDAFQDQIHGEMTPEEIVETQEALLSRAAILHKKGEIPGIGCWMICAPFKMLLLDQEHTYHSPVIDKIYPPLGRAVMRGVGIWMKKGYSSSSHITKDLLKSEDGGSLHEGCLTTTALVHSIETNIAKIADTRALPVNSGLWLLGQDDLVL